MTAPKSDIYQMQFHNPHAQFPLIIPVHVLCNTSNDDLHNNIRHNSALDLQWVAFAPEHSQIAVLVGGGPSVEQSIPYIRELSSIGATIFAMNGASKFLNDHGIAVNYQVIADAKPETSTLVDHKAKNHLIASQVDASTSEKLPNAALWHLGIDDMESMFPDERKKRGGYAIIGGGASVGNSALCLAYVMGFRTLHCFGYDSSHRGEASHAYDQPMNKFIPTIDVEWAGKKYVSSVAMKAQAEKFQITAQLLKQQGVKVHVHGDGLLPAMFKTPAKDLSEKDKYRVMWQFDGYREVSPGEQLVGEFLQLVRPDGLIVDFGCGTGRASLAMSKAGHEVFLIDFADNCRDEEAVGLPFLEWDLTRPLPVRSNYGFCTDVMEHIPVADVETVISNIMEASETGFFQSSTVQDIYGDVIGERLHHSIHPHSWWLEAFIGLGLTVKWHEDRNNASCFIITRTPSEGIQND